jgi:hypothetical protein
MPAIQPARLKIQVSHLVEKVSTPKEFISVLKDLLDFYSDRTRKPGRGSPQVSPIRSYNVPKQVSRRIEGELYPILVTQPERVLALADILWRENWLELRVFALIILGWVPADHPERIISRLKIWGKECGENHILNASLSRGLVSLWKETPGLFFDLLEFWLKSHDSASQKVGLRIIPPLVGDAEFMNLPRIFRSLTPFVQQIDIIPDIDVLKSIRALAHRSPQETAFFLQRNLAISENENIYSVIRQSLDAFPAPVREGLRTFLHKRREEHGRTHH